MLSASTGRGSQFRSRSSLRPWNNPQSTSRRCSPISTRYFDPVTVRAAPRNVSDAIEPHYIALPRADAARGRIVYSRGIVPHLLDALTSGRTFVGAELRPP